MTAERAVGSTVLGEREQVLERAARDASTAWTDAFFAELAKEGREVAGGWPGTIPEARARGAAQAERALAARSMAALSTEELERVTRITYNDARVTWRRTSAQREPRR